MSESWPELPRDAWRETRDTLHLWAQIVGKIRLALAPLEPEWAHVPLYVSARGLTTSAIPWGELTFEMAFDLVGHALRIDVSDGRGTAIALAPRSVAAFYAETMSALRALGITVEIDPRPQEIDGAMPFDLDEGHASYDARWARRYFDVLSRVDAVMKEHRGRFFGRTTPVQLFWGTFDLALTRFSGNEVAPPRSLGLLRRVAADAEQIEAGFWPGDERFTEPAFYAFAYPHPPGLEQVRVAPESAFWSAEMGEFILRYDDARAAASPREAILEFLESTYLACATVGGWDIAGLAYPRPGVQLRSEQSIR